MTDSLLLLLHSLITDCGVRPMREGAGRIVGGDKTKFGDWPWQVLVKESTWLGLFTKNKCGGVLISDRHVLTAAHCQPGFLASLMVELGEHDLTGPTEEISTMRKKVKRVVVHKDYKAPTFENDIAILELESDIERQPHIVPICMPMLSDKFEGKTAIVTGWGRLSYGKVIAEVLSFLSFPLSLLSDPNFGPLDNLEPLQNDDKMMTCCHSSQLSNNCLSFYELWRTSMNCPKNGKIKVGK